MPCNPLTTVDLRLVALGEVADSWTTNWCGSNGKKIGLDLLQTIVVPRLCVQNDIFTDRGVCASCWSYTCSVHVYSTGYLMAQYLRWKCPRQSLGAHLRSWCHQEKNCFLPVCAAQVQTQMQICIQKNSPIHYCIFLKIPEHFSNQFWRQSICKA